MADPLLAVVWIAVGFFGFDVIGKVHGWIGGSDDAGGAQKRETATFGSDLLKWGVATVLVVYVLGVERESLASIGVESMPPVEFVAWVVGGVAVTLALGAVANVAWFRLGWTTPQGFVEDQLERPATARAFTALTAGVTESILYQGYPIERIATLTGSLPLAAAVSFGAFVLAHYVDTPFEWQEVGIVAVPALCVTVLYVLTGNLLVVIAVHAIVDALSLLAPELGDAPSGSASPE